MLEQVARAAKAVVAAASAASGAAAQALVGDQVITPWEWVTVGAAAGGAFLLVYGVRNRPATAGDHVDQGD